eukprot:g28741.t1
MRRLKRTALPTIQPKLSIRYVDDTFDIIKCSKLEETLLLINKILSDIKFTSEEEDNDRLPFVDVVVKHKANGELQTSVHREATHTDQVFNYNSNHPNTPKWTCIKTLFKRAATHCSTVELRKAEEEHLSSIFRNNGYLKSVVRRYLHNRPQQEDTTCSETLVTLTYIKDISEMTTRFLHPLGIMVAHKPKASLRQPLMRIKDPTTATNGTNVIYKLP